SRQRQSVCRETLSWSRARKGCEAGQECSGRGEGGHAWTETHHGFEGNDECDAGEDRDCRDEGCRDYPARCGSVYGCISDGREVGHGLCLRRAFVQAEG